MAKNWIRVLATMSLLAFVVGLLALMVTIALPFVYGGSQEVPQRLEDAVALVWMVFCPGSILFGTLALVLYALHRLWK